VSGVLLPVISLLPFIGRNLEGKFAILKPGPNENDGYPNRETALDDGATVLTYGYVEAQTRPNPGEWSVC
jgi:large conductance mechanosensitive channel